MATTKIDDRTRWNTLHKNGPFPLKKFLTTRLEKGTSTLSDFEKYKDAAVEIRKLIKQADNTGECFRAIGSKWSMSNIAHCEDLIYKWISSSKIGNGTEPFFKIISWNF